MTPKILEKIVWVEANLGSYPQARAAFFELAGVDLTGKQVHRVTSQVGADCREERTWAKAPKLLRREMVASTQDADSFGWHLEWKACR